MLMHFCCLWNVVQKPKTLFHTLCGLINLRENKLVVNGSNISVFFSDGLLLSQADQIGNIDLIEELDKMCLSKNIGVLLLGTIIAIVHC
jgi:hypothetical protein